MLKSSTLVDKVWKLESIISDIILYEIPYVYVITFEI